MTTPTVRSLRSLLSLVVGLVLLVVMVVLLWPARFGGSAVFVVVRGESMEPAFHNGDLLYARTADEFEVGQIALYEMPVATTGETSLVVHRIVDAFDDGTYQFKGDNREVADVYRPHGDELVASPLANLGATPTQILLRLPLFLAVVVAITVTWALWPRSDETDLSSDAVPDDPVLKEPVPNETVPIEAVLKDAAPNEAVPERDTAVSLRSLGLAEPSWTPPPRGRTPAPTHRQDHSEATSPSSAG